MERKRVLQLVIVLIAVSVSVILLIYNIVREPSYDEVLARVESLMDSHPEVSITYRVEYQSYFEGVVESTEGVAYYSRNGSEFFWNNSLTIVEGSFYDLKPHELIDVMKLSIVDNVETYRANISCFLLNGLIAFDQADIADFIVEDFNYARLMACFDKVTGYPSQYTFFGVGASDGLLVSYNNFTFVPQEPEVLNETEITDRLVELAKELELS